MGGTVDDRGARFHREPGMDDQKGSHYPSGKSGHSTPPCENLLEKISAEVKVQDEGKRALRGTTGRAIYSRPSTQKHEKEVRRRP